MFVATALRRVLAVLGAGGVAVALVAGPAAAATPPTLSASAFWQLNGPLHTAVSLSATNAPGSPSTVFVQISQEFCDTHTNEMVFRGFSTQAAVKGVFVEDGRIRFAGLDTWVRAEEVDQRIPDCASPMGQPHEVDLGTVSVHLRAGWLGTGPVTQVQPGIQARAAHALAILDGPNTLGVGKLGPSQTAELRRSSF